MVGSFYFVLHSWLAGIAGRNKLLINMKAHLQRCAFFLLSFGLGFRVQGSGLSWRLRRFFYWGDARKWHLGHQSLVTPTIRGKESSHMRAIRSFDSVSTCSGWGFSHIGRFPPLRMTIREGGRALIWEIRCMFWNWRCYITIRVGPWRRAAPKAQDGSTRRCEKLCEAIRLPPVIPTDVEGSFLQSGKS